MATAPGQVACVVAVRLHRCVTRVRVAYRTAAPLTLEVLAPLAVAPVKLDRFSDLVPGASDHARLQLGDRTYGTAVVGGHRLDVTYGPPAAAATARERARIEGWLAERFGPVVHAGAP